MITVSSIFLKDIQLISVEACSHIPRSWRQIYKSHCLLLNSWETAGMGKWALGYRCRTCGSPPTIWGLWTRSSDVTKGMCSPLSTLLYLSDELNSIEQCVKGASRWAMYEVEPLPRWSKHHVTLLGDSVSETNLSRLLLYIIPRPMQWRHS